MDPQFIESLAVLCSVGYSLREPIQSTVLSVSVQEIYPQLKKFFVGKIFGYNLERDFRSCIFEVEHDNSLNHLPETKSELKRWSNNIGNFKPLLDKLSSIHTLPFEEREEKTLEILYNHFKDDYSIPKTVFQEVFKKFIKTALEISDNKVKTTNDHIFELKSSLQRLEFEVKEGSEQQRQLLEELRKSVLVWQKICPNSELDTLSIRIDDRLGKIESKTDAILKILTSTNPTISLDPKEIESEIETYLSSLVNKKPFKEITTIYTPLRAYEELQFSKNANNRQKVLIKDFEVHDLVKIEKNLILSGDSGSGKTTTLRWLTAIYARNYLINKQGEIPLYIELNTFFQGSFFDHVRIKSSENGLRNEEILRYLLKEGKVIFFIDGLDILKGQENNRNLISELLNFLSENPFHCVISSQPGHFDSFTTFKTVKLGELSGLLQMQTFMKKTINDYARQNPKNQTPPDKKFYRSLENQIKKSPELTTLCKNPLMFYLVIGVALDQFYACEKELIPSNRSEVYDRFVKKGVFRHFREKTGTLSTDDEICIQEILVDFYFALKCKNKTSSKKNDALKIFRTRIDEYFGFHQLNGKKPGNFLDEICEMGLLKTNGDLVLYGIHQSFQDFYSAIRLAEMYADGKDLSPVFSHPLWENSVIFAAGMVETPDEFVTMLVENRNVHLAAKCSMYINNVTKQKIKEKLIPRLESRFSLEICQTLESLGKLGDIGTENIAESLESNRSDVVVAAVQALGEIKSEQAVESLIHQLNNENFHIRQLAFKVLNEINPERTIDPLISILKNKNSNNQEWASRSIGKIKSERVILPLISLLKNENSYIRHLAGDILWEIKSEQAVDPLISLLNDENTDVRLQAIRIVSEIKSKQAVDPLISLLNDNNPVIREWAAWALGKIKSEQAVYPLISLVNDNNLEVRKQVIWSLGDIKSKQAVDSLISLLNDNYPDIRESAAWALGKIKSERAVDPLISLLNDNNSKVCMRAIGSLYEIKSERAVELLISLLNSKNPYARFLAAKTLPIFKSENTIEPLITLLNDNNPDVRGQAVESLGEIKSERAVEPLIPLLNDNNFDLFKQVVWSLGEIKSERAVEPLIPLLYDGNSEVRLLAVGTLRKIKSERTIEPLIALLNDKNPEVLKQVVSSLCEQKSEKAIEPLVSLLGDSNYDVRKYAIRLLGKIKSERAVEPLIPLLNDENDHVRVWTVRALGEIKSERAVESLIPLLNDENVRVREQTVWSLGEIKSKRAVDPLISLLNDNNPEIREWVVWSLGEIKSERAVESFISLLNDPDTHTREQAAWALGEMKSERAVEPLIAQLNDENTRVREWAARSLGKIKSKRAIEPLISLLSDNNLDVREWAARALNNTASINDEKTLEKLLESPNIFAATTGFQILTRIKQDESAKRCCFI